MDPFTISMIVGAIFGAAVITFWDNVREWVEDNVIPFIQSHFPQFESITRNAFAKLDGVAVNIRNMAKKAWQKLREILLKTVITIERVSSNTATRKIKSWLMTSTKKETVTVRETEEVIHADDIPPDIAAEFLRKGVKSASEDYTKHREEEFHTLELQS